MNVQRELFFIKQLGWRLASLLLLWAFCRLGFYFFNAHLFPEVSSSQLSKLFFFGIRFDLVSVIYVNLLLAFLSLLPFSFRKKDFYQKILKFIFIGFNAIALAFEIIDIGYFRFAFRRFILSDFFLVAETSNLYLKFIADFWYLFIIYLALLALLFFIYKKTNCKIPEEKLNKNPQFLIFIFGIITLLIGARGGLQKRPLMAITAVQYVGDSRLMPIQSNTSLNIIFSTQQRLIDKKHFFTKEKQESIFSFEKNPNPSQPFKKENVFIIVMESFGKEAVGYFNGATNSPTPFLDSLMLESWYFENAYASGFRSTEGIAAIAAGVPSLMEDPIMFSAYQANPLNSLASLLKNKDYSSAFFHGSNPGSMEFERFSKIIGYQEFYDKTRYPDQADYNGSWGIHDRPFFQFSIKEIEKYNKPFTALLFSLSSHHPYKVEDWFEEKFPNDKPIVRGVRYADYALREFFETAKKTDWYDNTLFVITADHLGRSRRPRFRTGIGIFQIPLFFYKPNSELKRKDNRVIQQTDIIPTVLDYLNYDESYLSFGTSAYDTTSNRYAYTFTNGIYQIINDSLNYTTNLERPYGLNNYQIDTLLKNDLRQDLIHEKEELDQQLKAVIQAHNEAMIDNKLTKRK